VIIDHAFEAKGTHIYFVDPGGEVSSDAPAAIRKLTCPTAVPEINGGTVDRIDTTCLDIVGRFRTNIPGFADPADVAIPFILYAQDGGHRALKRLQNSGAQTHWWVGLSDSVVIPDELDSEGNMVVPEDREAFHFMGGVANLTFTIDSNDVVRGTVTIRPSGDTTWVQVGEEEAISA
jgi:hypothetical protein